MGNSTLRVRNFVARTPEHLGWRSTYASKLAVSLLRSLCSLRFPFWGYQKNTRNECFFHSSFFIFHSSCPMGNYAFHACNYVARTPEHWRSMRLNKQDCCTDYVFCCFQVEVWQLLIKYPTNSWKIVILFCFYA